MYELSSEVDTTNLQWLFVINDITKSPVVYVEYKAPPSPLVFRAMQAQGGQGGGLFEQIQYMHNLTDTYRPRR
jgi:hypothetical protein